MAGPRPSHQPRPAILRPGRACDQPSWTRTDLWRNLPAPAQPRVLQVGRQSRGWGPRGCEWGAVGWGALGPVGGMKAAPHHTHTQPKPAGFPVSGWWSVSRHPCSGPSFPSVSPQGLPSVGGLGLSQRVGEWKGRSAPVPQPCPVATAQQLPRPLGSRAAPTRVTPLGTWETEDGGLQGAGRVASDFSKQDSPGLGPEDTVRVGPCSGTLGGEPPGLRGPRNLRSTCDQRGHRGPKPGPSGSCRPSTSCHRL